jgi:molybdopterin/thiamine biosynthesis adenylyltransferase
MGKKMMHQFTDEKPIIIAARSGAGQLRALKKRLKVLNVMEIFSEQLDELFEIQNPSAMSDPDLAARLKKFKAKKLGNWVYFPWSKTLLHVVKEQDLFALRTNRNKNLINQGEQETLSKFTVAVAGLSIGNNLATNICYSGMSSAIKIADFDTLATSNLNRIKARLSEVRDRKIKITARQIYEVNPYAKITFFSGGVNNKNLKQFVHGNPKPKLIFDAIDDFEMKIRIRQEARKAKIPVIMLTSLGDSLLVDVERFDLQPKLPLFNGLIGKTPEEILSKPVTAQDKNRYAVQIVGRENVPERAIESLKEIGKSLVGRPQLISTVMVGSGAAAYLAREIALRRNIKSGRKLIRFSDTFQP